MSVFKRKGSPFWQSEIDFRKSHGIRSIRSTGTASRREAEAFDRDHEAEIRKQLGQPKRATVTLDEACGRYWIEKGQHLGWAEHVERHLKWIVSSIGGDLALHELRTVDVGTMCQSRKANGAGAAGVNRSLAVLRQVLGRAAKVWGVEIHPIDWTAHWQTEPKGRLRWLTPTEAQRLLAALPEHIRLAAEWSLYTGTRLEETFGLTWKMVDFERGYVEVDGKTGKRVVWLSAQKVSHSLE